MQVCVYLCVNRQEKGQRLFFNNKILSFEGDPWRKSVRNLCQEGIFMIKNLVFKFAIFIKYWREKYLITFQKIYKEKEVTSV